MGTSGEEAAWSRDGVLSTARWNAEEVTTLALGRGGSSAPDQLWAQPGTPVWNWFYWRWRAGARRDGNGGAHPDHVCLVCSETCFLNPFDRAHNKSSPPPPPPSPLLLVSGLQTGQVEVMQEVLNRPRSPGTSELMETAPGTYLNKKREEAEGTSVLSSDLLAQDQVQLVPLCLQQM